MTDEQRVLVAYPGAKLRIQRAVKELDGPPVPASFYVEAEPGLGELEDLLGEGVTPEAAWADAARQLSAQPGHARVSPDHLERPMSQPDAVLRAEVLRRLTDAGGGPAVVREPFVVDGELQARKMAEIHHDLVDDGLLAVAGERLYWIDPRTGQRGSFTQYRLAAAST